MQASTSSEDFIHCLAVLTRESRWQGPTFLTYTSLYTECDTKGLAVISAALGAPTRLVLDCLVG